MIHGCSGGPVPHRPLPHKDIPLLFAPAALAAVRVLPRGGYPRAFSLGVSTLDTSSAAACPVVGGGDYSEVSGWFPPSCVDMGVLGGVARGAIVARTVFGRCAAPMVYARPIPRGDGCGHLGSGVS